MPPEGHALIAILVLFSMLTFLIYVDEIRFIYYNIKRGSRTIWVLASYPVYAVTALTAILIPRSGVVVDMIANTFFVTCLYNFSRLMTRYMGGTSRLWKVFDSGRVVAFNTFPVCCCCLCLPRHPFQMSVYNYMRVMVLQVVIVRPIMTFVAVVLWADGTFTPGSMSFYNPYTYVDLANVVSTLMAVYGMMLLRNAFQPELELHFKITGKVLSVQLALVFSVLPKTIVGILVATDVISCGPIFSSRARGEAIYHTVMILLMLPLSLVARKFFRRASDNESYLDRKVAAGLPVATPLEIEDNNVIVLNVGTSSPCDVIDDVVDWFDDIHETKI
jgi:organic solute transporter subunit alpha